MKTRKPIPGIRQAIPAVLLLATLADGCVKNTAVMEKRLQSAPLEIVGTGVGRPEKTVPIPATRATGLADGGTLFSDGDRLGLFLRDGAPGAGYTPVDNRIVRYTAAGSRWTIDGLPILTTPNTALVSLYFPYKAAAAIHQITVSAGTYNADDNDVVYLQKQAWAGQNILRLGGMKHAMARLKIGLSKEDSAIPGHYTGPGQVTQVEIADAAGGNKLFTAGKLDLSASMPAVSGSVAGSVVSTATRTLTTSETDAIYDLIVFPLASFGAQELLLRVTVDGNVLTTHFPATPIDAWTAGNAYLYSVTVKNKMLVMGTATIGEWVPGGEQTAGPSGRTSSLSSE